MSPTRSVIEILRDTLAELERCQEMSQDDPSVHELRRSILRTIADLEFAQDERAAAA